ncbi:SRPBCC family protein [Halapricum desulfuricans]|uniref:Polyketide cyclase/dehydrase family protein involved in binding/transport of lipids n=1 Tax=Halapricum desulfuricans TaxID=2841257 RepID=A0A897N8W8_9EURY|nr:SRPBCC family protein [Halapricum desulfuricans]QSG07593.1 Polyketide cyclase/dehydrase family protein involved in binding/transport of lipids [Halapricum desulfuricans]
MFHSEAELTVSVPPRTAFSFVADPYNLVKLIPGLLRVTEVTERSDGTRRGRYEYELAGISLTGAFEDTHHEEPALLVRSLTGAVEGTWRYRFEDAPGGTTITHVAELEFPETVLDRLPELAVQAYVDGEIQTAIATLRAFLNVEQ